MTGIETSFRVLLVSALVFLLAAGGGTCLEAQSGALADPAQAAQAHSEEEFDRYLEVTGVSAPRQVIAAVDAFVAQFPASEFLAGVYQREMHAYEQLNDFDGMLAAGRKALHSDPNNVNILLSLSPAMANRADAGRADREQLLSQAEEDAGRALKQLDSTRISRKVSLEQWDVEKRQMQSTAHGVLGMVALQRRQGRAAVEELNTSIRLSPQPQGVQFLRLGMAEAAIKSKGDAERDFRRASELGPQPVASVAAHELKKLASR